MKAQTSTYGNQDGITLVLGGTGKTGRRVAERLEQRGVQTRIASRSADPSFDWNEPTTWDAALEGVTAAYITYAPDLAIPGATGSIRAFVEKATLRGVKRMVLLSGRGEVEAQDESTRANALFGGHRRDAVDQYRRTEPLISRRVHGYGGAIAFCYGPCL